MTRHEIDLERINAEAGQGHYESQIEARNAWTVEALEAEQRRQETRDVLALNDVPQSKIAVIPIEQVRAIASGLVSFPDESRRQYAAMIKALAGGSDYPTAAYPDSPVGQFLSAQIIKLKGPQMLQGSEAARLQGILSNYDIASRQGWPTEIAGARSKAGLAILDMVDPLISGLYGAYGDLINSMGHQDPRRERGWERDIDRDLQFAEAGAFAIAAEMDLGNPNGAGTTRLAQLADLRGRLRPGTTPAAPAVLPQQPR